MLRWLSFALLVACGHENASTPGSADAGAEAPCPDGLERLGSLCATHFDSCDERSVPKPGGGCERVGVSRCAAGFRDDGRGGCDAVLPTSCPEGLMAIPGEAACRPVSSCDAPPAGAIHVDAAYVGESDGTAAKPFRTIVEALSAGDTIAIAPGVYDASLSLERPTTLVGRCAAKVDIASTIAVRAKATLRGLSVKGIDASEDLLAEDVRVYEGGINATAGGTLRNVLVEKTVGPGVVIKGGVFVIEKSVIRDAQSASLPGYPLMAVMNLTTGEGRVRVSDSVIENGHGDNVFACTALTIERSVVRGGMPFADIPSGGLHVSGCSAPGATTLRRASLEAHDILIEGGVGASLAIATADAKVARATLRRPVASASRGGIGLLAFRDTNLQVTEMIVEAAERAGVAVLGGVSEIDHVLVRDTKGQADGLFGIGVAVTPDSTTASRADATLKFVRVANARVAGIAVLGSAARVTGAAVFGALAETATGKYGDGFAVAATGAGAVVLPAELTVDGAVVRESARVAFSTFGAKLSVSHASAQCAPFDLDYESSFVDATGAPVGNRDPELRDNGGNACGCGAPLLCKAGSSGLEPIKPP